MKTIYALFLLLASTVAAEVRSASYYLDSNAGDDALDGKTAHTAWRSLERANRETFQPGDRLLLKAGSKWEGTSFRPRGSGRDGQPIVVDRYGEGAKPALHGEGKVEA